MPRFAMLKTGTQLSYGNYMVIIYDSYGSFYGELSNRSIVSGITLLRPPYSLSLKTENVDASLILC